MLAVWLPLNGNLNNQGIYPVTVTSGTAAYVTGKIGQGLNLSKRVSFNCSALAGCKKFSVAFWVMLEDNENITSNWQDIIGFTDQTSDNSTNGQLRAETCYATNQSLSNFGVHWHDNATYAMTTGNLIKHYTGDRGIWHHCVMTIDSEGKMGGYVDGNFITEYATNNPGGHLTGAFWIGENNNIAGRINDVRIYKNQILTSKEAKKLSQGLVLHLPLSRKGFGQDNLALDTQAEQTCVNNFKYWLLQSDKVSDIAGNIITVSADIKASVDNVQCDTYIRKSSGMLGTRQIIKGIGTEYKRFSVTFTAVSDTTMTQIAFRNNSNAGANTSATYYYRNVKVELGDKATPWIPNVADTLYTKINIEDIVEKDISGYQNNADKAGEITITNDAPSLPVSYNFGTTGRIGPINVSLSSLSGNWTISWWSKVDSASNIMPWAFNGGNKLNFYWSGTGLYWNTGDSTQNPFRNDSGTTIKFTTYLGDWHHFVVVSNGETNTLYIDGEYMGKSKTYKDPTSDVLYISGYGYALSTTYSWKGDISDFRLYATALSADDVRDLYEKR